MSWARIKKSKALPWHIRIKLFLETGPKRPFQIQKHFSDLTKPTLFKTLNKLEEWNEITKTKDGKYVVFSYTPLKETVLKARRKLRSPFSMLKEFPDDISYITSERLLKETAAWEGKDPLDPGFREDYRKAVKWLLEHPEEIKKQDEEINSLKLKNYKQRFQKIKDSNLRSSALGGIRTHDL